MMIPHHQGAIEMAQAVLRYGRNPQMQRLAQETGARAMVALDERNLDPLYRSIASELAHQYSLGYVPVSTTGKNQFARISVLVRGSHRVARTRSGYVARNQR